MVRSDAMEKIAICLVCVVVVSLDGLCLGVKQRK